MKPKLRFKEFSGDWESDKIKNLFLINAGGDIDLNRCTKEKTEKNIYPVYANSIEKNGLYGYSDLYKVEEPCITVTGRGINVGLAIPRAEKFYPIVRLLVLIPLKPLDINFFAESINLSKIFIESTGIPQLTAPQIGKVKLKFPSLPEQTKIADFLSTVDEKIQNQQYKITHLENIKKGFMQKIFSRKIRFKDSNGNEFPEWEEKKLKDCCEYQSSSVSTSMILENANYELFDANGKIGYTDSFCDKKYISIIKDGAGVGRTRILPKNSFCISTMGIITSNKYSVIEYLYYMISQLDFIKYIVGATIPHIYFKDYGNEKIELPCLEEQQKIADFLSSFDDKIDAEKETLEHLKELKKGLLQQMFV